MCIRKEFLCAAIAAGAASACIGLPKSDKTDILAHRGILHTPCSDERPSCRPETWFHIIGGNASKEGIAADIAAIAEAGIGGIQFFHGGWAKEEPWPGVTNMIPCLSESWVDLVKFTETECHRRGLTFKMQNCPGWSMSGGPWITPDKAMRRLVCFQPGKKPAFDADDDYREIGEVTFPLEDSPDMSITVPNPRQINHAWAYEPDADIVLCDGPKEKFRVRCPRGAWQDGIGMTFRVPGFPISGWKLFYYADSSHYPRKELNGSWMTEPRLDMWEAKAGWAYRSFAMSTNASPVKTKGERTLVFGHVNAKRRNHPAPPEGTGWECDKMDARGFEANFAGYLGKLLKAGVKIDGTLVDSWECGCQTWTWKMEEEFERRAGYALRPWLPALFGYVLKNEAETERFLLDWRNVCSRLVEENYYGTIARLARENGMSVQYETAFGDVIPGDPLRFWKFADEPMCEFWSPHRNEGFVGSFDFKPILPCVSAAHVYGKRRVSAEALTSFELTFDENFKDWKKIVDEHFARGVTHVVLHTYTHNPVVGGKPPSTSFGAGIGSPFLREQTWWPFLKHFSKYIERCGAELERGLPAVDILMYLGDDVGYRPSEHDLMFGNRYKYDYLNNDALMTRLVAKDGKVVLPDGMTYRVIWIPKDTFLLPATEAKLAELANRGARIVRGDFVPDWPSPFEKFLGRDPAEVVGWFHRRDADTELFFVAEKDGTSRFFQFPAAGKGNPVVYDPVSGEESPYSDYLAARRRDASASVSVELKPLAEYPAWAVKRTYEGKVEAVPGGVLNLGKVRDWATVYINGKKAVDLWCEPYSCDITPFLEGGRADIRVEVTSTWYNALVHDAGLPEEERMTWTKNGPKPGSPYHDAGLLDRTAILRLHSSGTGGGQ